MFCNLIRRAPAREISAEDTMALIIINKIKTKIAVNKLIRFQFIDVNKDKVRSVFKTFFNRTEERKKER
ncbi:hypothetical protein HMPREF9996_01083 [Aggregatibacter actinomycetemcomitans Y4]|nr:hypothetical protein HMPREF9996_01083 [Aggregatibacter actinomycetemcomitans Y4]